MKKLIIILSLIVAFPVSASFDKNLYYGMLSDSNISELQEFLNDQGFSVPITGNFFSLTLKAVKNFQAANGISQTGYFGSLSRAKANELLSLNESEQEAILDTGTTTPKVELPKTNSDLITKIQEQINSLLQQVSLMQQQVSEQQAIKQKVEEQTQIIQQQQETLNQIASNTVPTPPPVIPEVISVPVIIGNIEFVKVWDNGNDQFYRFRTTGEDFTLVETGVTKLTESPSHQELAYLVDNGKWQYFHWGQKIKVPRNSIIDIDTYREWQINRAVFEGAESGNRVEINI